MIGSISGDHLRAFQLLRDGFDNRRRQDLPVGHVLRARQAQRAAFIGMPLRGAGTDIMIDPVAGDEEKRVAPMRKWPGPAADGFVVARIDARDRIGGPPSPREQVVGPRQAPADMGQLARAVRHPAPLVPPPKRAGGAGGVPGIGGAFFQRQRMNGPVHQVGAGGVADVPRRMPRNRHIAREIKTMKRPRVRVEPRVADLLAGQCQHG